MLDLKTVLIVTLASASLQALVWIAVWRAWRQLYPLKLFALGFSAIAVGVLLMLLRGAQPVGWAIVLHNLVIKLGLVLLASGLAGFLVQPRHTWVGIALLVFQLVVWSIALAFDPGNIAIRIHSSTLFTVVMMCMMCLMLWRDRSQPRLLCWITIGVLVEYMAASLLHSALAIWWPAHTQDTTVLNNRNAWYLLQGALFLIALFACLLFMVSWRLATDLRANNAALSREIQQRRRLQQQLQTSLDTERALREEQADFMRLVSHEFRTPLAIIRRSTDMIHLTDGNPTDATATRFASINQALERLFSLVDRFLSNERDSGFQPKPLPASSLMAKVRRHAGMSGHNTRLRFTTHTVAGTLFADPDMLVTVITNLIDNALKYSPAQQAVVVEARIEHDSLVVQVRDHGIGIPPAERHKVGRCCFRASNTTAGTGSGLGLYTARKLLAYHHGSLALLPNAGLGTTALVRVPLAGAATELAPAEETRTWHMY